MTITGSGTYEDPWSAGKGTEYIQSGASLSMKAPVTENYLYDKTLPYWNTGVPRWGLQAGEGVASRTKGLRGHQTGAMDILGGQTTGTTAAERMAAYQGERALQKGAGAVGAGGGVAATRAAMGGLGAAESNIASKAMGQAADERRRSLDAYSSAAAQAARGQQALEKERLAYATLANKDKWGMMRADIGLSRAQQRNAAARSHAQQQITDEEYKRILQVIDASADAVSVGAAGLSSADSYEGSYGSSYGTGNTGSEGVARRPDTSGSMY
jgi:hypothetical protein